MNPMPIFDLYSRRKRPEQADVYQYDDIPKPVRVQIVNLWRWAIGPVVLETGWPRQPNWSFWDAIHDGLAHEKGVPALADGDDPFARCMSYFISERSIDDLLDLLELTFRYIADLAELKEYQRTDRGITMTGEDAIYELNFRLREAGVGFQFEGTSIIQLDSQYVHSEAVKPALSILSDKRFHGPQQEFLHAHEEYRKARPEDHKKLEDVVAGALKSFESTLKVICDLKKWQYDPKATAAPLVQLVIDKGLIPSYLQSSLEGLATLRNRIGGHGQGSQIRDVPYYLASYALHLSASNIVMLVEAFKATSRGK